MSTQPKSDNRHVHLNRDGLPIDPRDWTPADWQDLYEAMRRAKQTIADRYLRDRE